MEQGWQRHVSSFVAAISILSLFSGSLDLGYLAASLVQNYQNLRDLVWFPFSFIIELSGSTRDIITFWSIFVPLFILRGDSQNNFAAISFMGSTVIVIVFCLLCSIGLAIDALTGVFTWFGRVLDDEVTGFWPQTLEVIVYSIFLPFMLSTCGLVYSWFYWWLAFVLPHLGVAIQKTARSINFDLYDFIRDHMIYIPYSVGCDCLRKIGRADRIYVQPDEIAEREEKFMSWVETKSYYLPARDVAIAFVGLLLLSKILFDSV